VPAGHQPLLHSGGFSCSNGNSRGRGGGKAKGITFGTKSTEALRAQKDSPYSCECWRKRRGGVRHDATSHAQDSCGGGGLRTARQLREKDRTMTSASLNGTHPFPEKEKGTLYPGGWTWQKEAGTFMRSGSKKRVQAEEERPNGFQLKDAVTHSGKKSSSG